MSCGCRVLLLEAAFHQEVLRRRDKRRIGPGAEPAINVGREPLVETLARVVAQGEAVRTCPKGDDGDQASFLFRDQNDAAQKSFGVAERMAHGNGNFRLNSRGSSGQCHEFETLRNDLLMRGGAWALPRRERFGQPFRRRVWANVVWVRTDVN